jgi:AcrR family transcriptional regulator
MEGVLELSKKEELLHHTYELFSRLGESLTLSIIARSVNIKKASIYAHVESKEELLYQVIAKQIQHYSTATLHQLSKNESLPFDLQLKHFYLFNVNYFHEPTRLLFWKRCLLLSESPLRDRVEKEHQEVHNRNIRQIASIYLKSADQCGLSSDFLPIFTNAYVVLILGTLYSLSVYENDYANYEQSYEIFWKGLQQHTRCTEENLPISHHSRLS